MRLLRLIYLSFIFFGSFSTNFIFSMNSNEQDFYQSDSEDESDYELEDYKHLQIPEDHGRENIALFRGIHFTQINFSKQKISEIRRSSEVGKSIYSTEALRCTHVGLGSVYSEDQEKELKVVSENIKKLISKLTEEQRNRFQQLYTNQYNKFHSQLKKPEGEFKEIFEKLKCLLNPLVSVTELFSHAAKYASGERFPDDITLNPEYDGDGKAKHPYLGKIYMILIDVSCIKDQDSFFVISKHANYKVDIKDRYLHDREVTFTGFIPGKYIVYDQVVRVPSKITGEYKEYYKSKYGLSTISFTLVKDKIEAINSIFKNLPVLEKNKLEIALNGLRDKEIIIQVFFNEDENDKKLTKELTEEKIKELKQILKKRKEDIIKKLIDNIIVHLSGKLEKHVKKECTQKDITVVYKSLNKGFCSELPDIKNDVKPKRKKIQDELVDSISDKYKDEIDYLDDDDFISKLKDIIKEKEEYHNYDDNDLLSKNNISLHLYLFNDLNDDLKRINNEFKTLKDIKKESIKRNLKLIKQKIKDSQDFKDEKKFVIKRVKVGDPLRSVSR